MLEGRMNKTRNEADIVRTDNSKKLSNSESFYTQNKIIISGKLKRSIQFNY